MRSNAHIDTRDSGRESVGAPSSTVRSKAVGFCIEAQRSRIGCASIVNKVPIPRAGDCTDSEGGCLCAGDRGERVTMPRYCISGRSRRKIAGYGGQK